MASLIPAERIERSISPSRNVMSQIATPIRPRPNDIICPSGFGPQRFVAVQSLGYTVHFRE